jgi:glycine/D-amino acid oxidase-like deaminating enzyme
MPTRRGIVQGFGLTAALAYPRTVYAAGRNKVVVIGAGIMGASIAYHMAKRGAQVTLLDKTGPAAGTTRNSFAWLNSASKSPKYYFDLNLMGVLGWRRLELEIGPDLPIQWGGCVEWGPATLEQAARRRAAMVERQNWGYPVREIDAAEVRQLLPGAVTDNMGFADFCDIEGTIDPVVATNVLVAKAKDHGASAIHPCTVTGLDLGDSGVKAVQTSQGKIEADHVVIAAGNDCPRIAAMAGFEVPLTESKGILVHSKPMARVLDRVARPPGNDAKQNLDGRVIVEQTFGDISNSQPDAALGRAYLDHLAQYVPAVRAAEVEFMTLGYRVMPKDGHPIFDRAPKYPNLYVAAQHSGMTCAPISGQLLAMEVLDQVQVDMLAPYRLARFT